LSVSGATTSMRRRPGHGSSTLYSYFVDSIPNFLNSSLT
jgi:hypothetical protein